MLRRHCRRARADHPAEGQTTPSGRHRRLWRPACSAASPNRPLYGIHLRYKKIYPRMLLGCLVGGLIIGIGGGVKTGAFAFTSLLTIPVFDPMLLYTIAIAAAFFTAMFMVISFGFRTKEETAEALAEQGDRARGAGGRAAPRSRADGPPHRVAEGGGGAAMATAVLLGTDTLGAPVSGQVVAIDQVNDVAFASKLLGEGVGIKPSDGQVVSPVSGKVMSSPHAYGIQTGDGVEVLVHIGIDTVKLKGENFTVLAQVGEETRPATRWPRWTSTPSPRPGTTPRCS